MIFGNAGINVLMYTGISIAIPTGTDRDNCNVGIGSGDNSLRSVKRKLRTFSRNFNLRHMSIMCTSTNLAALGWLNKYTQIKKLDITRIVPGSTDLDAILNFMYTNTTIDNLNIESFISGPNKWVTFIKLLSRNTFITSLTITGSISYPADVANYISASTTLRELSIRLDDLEIDHVLASALRTNTYLTSIAIFTEPYTVQEQGPGVNERGPGHGHAGGYAEGYILELIEKTSSLKSLTVTNSMLHTFNSDKFAKSLVKNTSINFVKLDFYLGHNPHKFVDAIKSNLTITQLVQHELTSRAHFDDPLQRILERNRRIMWRRVHPTLLDFTLIFHFLPPYIVLEIYDHIEFMDLVRHYTKIQLIIAVKRSIVRAKK